MLLIQTADNCYTSSQARLLTTIFKVFPQNIATERNLAFTK